LNTLEYLPDGTSPNNQGIAAFATESRETAAAENRLTWLDLLLEKAMAISASANPDALIDHLDELQSLAAQWQGAITARHAEPVVTE
jgi:hypothetical protein